MPGISLDWGLLWLRDRLPGWCLMTQAVVMGHRLSSRSHCFEWDAPLVQLNLHPHLQCRKWPQLQDYNLGALYLTQGLSPRLGTVFEERHKWTEINRVGTLPRVHVSWEATRTPGRFCLEKRTHGWLGDGKRKKNIDLIFTMYQALYKGLKTEKHSCPHGAYAKL